MNIDRLNLVASSALCAFVILILLGWSIPVVLLHRRIEAARRTDALLNHGNEPPLMLWVWEYPADLHAMDPTTTGAAILVSTLSLKGDQVTNRGRLQPFSLPSEAYRYAVVRIETDSEQPPTLGQAQLDELVQQVLNAFASIKSNGLQIDFDARTSEREFYKTFLLRLRASLPAAVPLSMTALSSWCLDDVWIRELPVDEVVPMFFSMGAGSDEASQRVSDGKIASLPQRLSMGFSVAERGLIEKVPHLSEHVFLFSTHGWSNNKASDAIQRILTRTKIESRL